jgi:hypothetical protein
MTNGVHIEGDVIHFHLREMCRAHGVKFTELVGRRIAIAWLLAWLDAERREYLPLFDTPADPNNPPAGTPTAVDPTQQDIRPSPGEEPTK